MAAARSSKSIEKVLSVDLVANPATTDGLFEDASAGRNKGESRDDVSRLTLDDLRSRRPDLVAAMQESLDRGDELRRLRETVRALATEQAARHLHEAIDSQLKAAGLDPANRVHCSEVFLEDLRGTADAAVRHAKIDDRRALVAAARPSSSAPTTGSVAMLEALDALSAARDALRSRAKLDAVKRGAGRAEQGVILISHSLLPAPSSLLPAPCHSHTPTPRKPSPCPTNSVTDAATPSRS